MELREKNLFIVIAKKQTNPETVTFSKLDRFFFWNETKIKTNKNQIQTNTAEVHAFIVVIISSSADCKTERTIVHEKHNSPKKNPSYIFTVSGIIYILYIYNVYSCLDL